MKTTITTGFSYTVGQKKLDFSAVPSFDNRRLYAVINVTRGELIYAVGQSGLTGDWTNGVVTLEADLTGHANLDDLMVVYEVPEAANAGGATAARQDEAKALLASMLTAIQSQRSETIWTDDTGTRFIRVNIGGLVGWTKVDGTDSPGPQAGARPDNDSASAVARQTFKATASGTGFSVGDYIDHFVVTDESGDLVGNFWVNLNTGARISVPSAANVIMVSSLAENAATDSKLEAIRLLLAAAQTIQGTVTANLGTIGNAATADRQETGNTALAALVAANGDVADPATTNIAAGGASFTFRSLFKGMVSLLSTISTRLAGTLTVQGAVTVSDGSGPLSVDGAVSVTNFPATQPISAAALPLPTSAATDAKVEAVRALLAGTLTVQGAVQVSDASGPLTVDGSVNVANFPATQPISAASLPLPTNAATDAKVEAVRALLAGTLTNSEVPVGGVIDMPSAGVAYTAGRGVEIATTTAGAVILTYADGSTRTRTFQVGLSRLPDAVTKWAMPGGSTWAGTVCNLK